jgi:deoxyribose-phosphate aldolase
MAIATKELARLLDVSLLKTENTATEIQSLIEASKKYNFVCAFVLPAYLPEIISGLKGTDTDIGGTIGFPTGAELSQVKAFQAKTCYDLGCDEFDMVMNVGFLKSKRFDLVAKDIQAVKDQINGKSMKVIVESSLLTEKELRDATKIVIDAGADYVKTGSGWAPKPTLLSHVEIMANVNQGRIKMKAAGGIRDLEILEAMYNLGVTRFGVGLLTGVEMMEASMKGQTAMGKSSNDNY